MATDIRLIQMIAGEVFGIANTDLRKANTPISIEVFRTPITPNNATSLNFTKAVFLMVHH